MKGIVFTEFSEYVEEKFGPEVVDQIVDNPSLPSRGIYTAVGTYDHRELVTMLVQLQKVTNIPVKDLVTAFGEHLLSRFVELYPVFFENIDSVFDFLLMVDEHIHVEVHKLYPEAELPRFEYQQPDQNTLKMIYRSTRHFGDLAEGLIKGSIAHFGESIKLTRKDLPNGEGSWVEFLMKRG